MKSLVASALVLASMTSVALAGSPDGNKVAPPVQLTNAELGQVSAGGLNIFVPFQGQRRQRFWRRLPILWAPQGNGGPGIFVQFVFGNGPK